MRVMLLAGLIAALAAAPVAAQDGASDEANNQIVREKLRADKKLLVAENMQLTDAEAAKFWPVYDAYQAEQAKLADRTAAVIKEYAANQKTLTDPQAATILKRWGDLQVELAQTRVKYIPLIEKVIPARKAAHFFQIDRRLYALMDLQVAGEVPLVIQ